jgi:hypothetical protein
MKGVVMGTGDYASLERIDKGTDTTEFLTKKSRELVSIAFGEVVVEPGGLVSKKPLTRVTEAYSAQTRSHGLLKRKDGIAHGMSGEDVFFRFPRLVSRSVFGEDATDDTSPQEEWNRWVRVEREFDTNEEHARPSREDPLWIRKGDELRTSSAKDATAAAYAAAIFRPPSSVTRSPSRRTSL